MEEASNQPIVVIPDVCIISNNNIRVLIYRYLSVWAKVRSCQTESGRLIWKTENVKIVNWWCPVPPRSFVLEDLFSVDQPSVFLLKIQALLRLKIRVFPHQSQLVLGISFPKKTLKTAVPRTRENYPLRRSAHIC